jgi:hypothetical protein
VFIDEFEFVIASDLYSGLIAPVFRALLLTAVSLVEPQAEKSIENNKTAPVNRTLKPDHCLSIFPPKKIREFETRFCLIPVTPNRTKREIQTCRKF